MVVRTGQFEILLYLVDIKRALAYKQEISSFLFCFVVAGHI